MIDQNKMKNNLKEGYPSLIGLGIAVIFIIFMCNTKSNKIEPQPINNTYNNTVNTPSTEVETCHWCGKKFTGEHYSHLGKISDCYTTSSNTITVYCSMKCCEEARASSCPSCR